MNKNFHIARKRFGQNFLQDVAIIQNIVDALNCVGDENIICEIGPGLGALTLPLLQKFKKINVIEIDKDLIYKLKNDNPFKAYFENNHLIIHEQDALKFELANLISNNQKIHLIGNLPYNISTPLLFRFLQQINNISEMIFMLQKEVVDRIIAKANSKDFGRLSVMMQTFFYVEKLFDVPPESFIPVPKVMSSVIRIIPKNNYLNIFDNSAKNAEKTEKIFTNLVEKYTFFIKTAFAQKRKTLHNNFKNTEFDILEKYQEELNLDFKKVRAENISIENFIALFNLSQK